MVGDDGYEWVSASYREEILFSAEVKERCVPCSEPQCTSDFKSRITNWFCIT